MTSDEKPLSIRSHDFGLAADFNAMASPCEVLFDNKDQLLVQGLAEAARAEALRIEVAFSRYRQDNEVYAINHSGGQPFKVSEELAALLSFADEAFRLSDGLFDITSGVLRRFWRFDGSDTVPSRKAVKTALSLIGWDKVKWNGQEITLLDGMEIDLGGIGKEYAVDRAASIIKARTPELGALINFGGDLYATRPPARQAAWRVGVESLGGGAAAAISLKQGGLATSGDARRYIERDGVRYPHVLNPRTGWPVMRAPRSITVAAPNCLQAGFLATLAMLRGHEAEAFLTAQSIKSWVQR